MAKRKVIIRRKKAYVPPKLPDKPKVTEGAKSYGRTKRGQYIVPRFWITQFMYGKWSGNVTASDPWYVIDMEEATIARGTKDTGYPKEKAIKIARRYRDEFGAWSTMPF